MIEQAKPPLRLRGKTLKSGNALTREEFSRAFVTKPTDHSRSIRDT